MLVRAVCGMPIGAENVAYAENTLQFLSLTRVVMGNVSKG